jgi:hypothetical protein
MFYFLSISIDAPTEFDVGLQNATVIEDEPLILECILTKDRPDDEVVWLFNGEPLLIDNERIKVSKVGPIVKLIIDECQLTDEGRYQAEINGKTSKANVVVTGKNNEVKSRLDFFRTNLKSRKYFARRNNSLLLL